MPDYIRWIRSQMGSQCDLILNFAGGVVRDNEGRLLLQKRADRVAWGFPGGAIELGESAEEAAVREVYEETGLRVKVDSLLGVYSRYIDHYPNGSSAQPIVIMFYCSIVGGNLDSHNDETLELKFFHPGELPPMFNSQHQDILDDACKKKSGVYR